MKIFGTILFFLAASASVISGRALRQEEILQARQEIASNEANNSTEPATEVTPKANETAPVSLTPLKAGVATTPVNDTLTNNGQAGGNKIAAKKGAKKTGNEAATKNAARPKTADMTAKFIRDLPVLDTRRGSKKSRAAAANSSEAALPAEVANSTEAAQSTTTGTAGKKGGKKDRKKGGKKGSKKGGKKGGKNGGKGADKADAPAA